MIRTAEIKDIPRIHALLKDILAMHKRLYPDRFEGDSKYGLQEIEEILNTKTVFVFEDEEVKGYLIGWKEGNIFFVDDLCVDSSYRRNHVGSQLMAYAQTYAKKIGCTHFDLNVWVDNVDAIAFYEKLGFKPLKKVLTKDL